MDITRHQGIAGQVAYSVDTPSDTPSGKVTVTFVGSEVYGGPVVIIVGGGTQSFVRDPGRFGKFGREWVEKFMDPERQS